MEPPRRTHHEGPSRKAPIPTRSSPPPSSAPPRQGKHADGNGLHLYVQPTAPADWVQRLVIHGRSRELGLGSARLVPLAEAREKAPEEYEAETGREWGDAWARASIGNTYGQLRILYDGRPWASVRELIAHEIGHAFGLFHTGRRNYVMNASEYMEDTFALFTGREERAVRAAYRAGRGARYCGDPQGSTPVRTRVHARFRAVAGRPHAADCGGSTITER